MTGFIFNKMIDANFGFAIEDYKAEYNMTDDDIVNKNIFGFILEPSDSSDELAGLIKIIDKRIIDMIIIDFHLLSITSPMMDCDDVENCFEENMPDYVELKDVYEDRFVFVKRPQKYYKRDILRFI